VQLIDAYTHNFAYLGSRATGNDGGSFILAGPRWQGEKPDGIKKVVRTETELAFALFRTQLFAPADLGNVTKIQAGYKVEPLSAFLGQAAPAAAPTIEFPAPLTPEEQKSSLEVFSLANFVLGFCPTDPSETELMERFREDRYRRRQDAQHRRPDPGDATGVRRWHRGCLEGIPRPPWRGDGRQGRER
jgi:hypothetical protein